MLVASTTKSSRATPTAVDVRPAHAIDCRAVKDPGCARFDTGTVESMRAQERSSGHKPVLASSGTSTHSAAWDILLRESGKSKCTASTTLSKDTDSTQAKPASNAGRSTWTGLVQRRRGIDFSRIRCRRNWFEAQAAP